MKKLFLLLAFAVTVTLQAQDKQKATDEKFPVMTFETKTHDFGTLHEGDVVKYVYKFKNTGDAPLIINKIRASCGCTVPSGWKKEPIMPGESGEFTVQFNTRNKIHKQRKTVTVYCNTKNKMERVTFTADVIPDPKMEKIREERRKKWMEQRKKRMEQRRLKMKNKGERNKKEIIKVRKKLTFEEKDQVKTHEIAVKKLEYKKLKVEQKLLRYEHKHKGNISAEKVKKYKEKIEELNKEIKKHRKAIDKIYE